MLICIIINSDQLYLPWDLHLLPLTSVGYGSKPTTLNLSGPLQWHKLTLTDGLTHNNQEEDSVVSWKPQQTVLLL